VGVSPYLHLYQCILSVFIVGLQLQGAGFWMVLIWVFLDFRLSDRSVLLACGFSIADIDNFVVILQLLSCSLFVTLM